MKLIEATRIKECQIILLTNLMAIGGALTANAEFIHPGIGHTREGIEFVKSRIESGDQPWLESWQELQDSKFASLKWEPKPRAHVERGASNRPNIGSSDFTNDSLAAYTHALHWALSGEEAHARKSAEIIDAWSKTLESISNHDARLLVGMNGDEFCNAAELLKYDWGKWPEIDQKRFEKMLRGIWYPIIEDFFPAANGNWDASMIQTMMAMGVYLEDREMFDRAVSYYKSGRGNGAVRNYFNEFGQCQESGRDQSHTQMGLEFLANTCETAWIQGVDLYGFADNLLLKGFEYTAKYNLGFEVPFERYHSIDGKYRHSKISDKARGKLWPMYQKVFNHYANRKGMEAPYTKQAALKGRDLPPDRPGMPWVVLMFTDQK